MKKRRIDLFQERQIITNMITNTEYLRRIRPIVKSKYFKSVYAKYVSEWILEYYDEFKESPGKDIQNLYHRKVKYINNMDDADLVSEFLLKLSKDWEKRSKIQNIDFSVKNSLSYLKLRSLILVKDKLELAIQNNEPLKGEQEIANFSKLETNDSDSINIFQDTGAICSAFLDDNEIMFSFPGVLGEVVGPFMRGDLISFLAFAKRGKSWWMMYLSQLAVYYGFKIAFFNLEMVKNQFLRRTWTGLVAQPRKDMDLKIPYFEEIKGEDSKFKWEVSFKEERRSGVNTSNIAKDQKAFKRQCRSGEMKMVPLPAFSATVEDIEAHLDNMYYYEEFIPDVIVVDYADIIAPSAGNREYRHQIDGIWKRLRRMAQERDVLLATASQAGRAASKNDASEENIAEDIRKVAHVSKLISINQDELDREQSAVRIGQLAERDGKRNWKQALVLQCLEIGKPYLDSRYVEEVER